MDLELKHFQKTNSSLGLIISDLKMRQIGMDNELEHQNKKLK